MAYVGSEWLFQVTKPSFLNVLSWPGQLRIALVATAWLLVATISATALLAGARWLARSPRLAVPLRELERLPAVATLAALALVASDNFLHTVLGWGTPRLEGWARVVPPTVFLVLLVGFARRARVWLAQLVRHAGWRRGVLAFAGATVISGILAGHVRVQYVKPEPIRVAQRWNIVLLGGDGIDAERLSMYGYERRTTPYLERLAAESLVAENAFSNGAGTGGSLVSILTSALPTETGVVFPPDTARPEWALRHLPGLLRSDGYATAQISIRWYADTTDLGLVGAFDLANERRPLHRLDDAGGQIVDRRSVQFLRLVGGRLAERLFPWLGSRESRESQRDLLGRRGERPTDRFRLDSFQSFVAATPGAFFEHVHLLGTHGPHFIHRDPVFSAGQRQEGGFDRDFYDDALLAFDRHVASVVEFLRSAGRLEQTILVVYSDHGQAWNPLRRVPLLVRLPGASRVGRLQRPVQNLDIAPTLLDALGTPAPSWMRGRSLLREGPACPPLLSAGFREELRNVGGPGSYRSLKPPFYSLATIHEIVGDRRVSIELPEGRVTSGEVEMAPGWEAACAPLDPARVALELVGHLAENGYRVGGLARRLRYEEE